jgi:hypothetical protein
VFGHIEKEERPLVLLLIQLLQINPFLRPSAEETLRNKLFDKYVRNHEFEKINKHKILLPFDEYDAFTYEGEKVEPKF